jgi:hypothetical protein
MILGVSGFIAAIKYLMSASGFFPSKANSGRMSMRRQIKRM